MKIPDHPSYIQNETVTIDGVMHPILKIEVEPGKLSDHRMLNFNWTFVNFTATELLIQLDFQNMLYVS